MVRVADLFMVLLLSRPATGSLRNTWVTPATLGLGLATGLGSILCLALVSGSLSGGWRVAAVVGLALFAVGSLCVATVGLVQRFAERR